jgi:hypothetical protein
MATPNKRQKMNSTPKMNNSTNKNGSNNPALSSTSTDPFLSDQYNGTPTPVIAYSQSRTITQVVPNNPENEIIDADLMAWLRGESNNRSDAFPTWNYQINDNGLPEIQLHSLEAIRLEDSINEPLTPSKPCKSKREIPSMTIPTRHSPRLFPGSPTPTTTPSPTVSTKMSEFNNYVSRSPLQPIRPVQLPSLFSNSYQRATTPRNRFVGLSDRIKQNNLVQQASQSLYDLKGSVSFMAPTNSIGFIHDVPVEFLHLIKAFSNFILSVYHSHQRDQPQ